MGTRTRQAAQPRQNLDVLHIVGTPTAVVLSYLVPAANALARAGLVQKVLFASSVPTKRPSRLNAAIDAELTIQPSQWRRWRACLKSLSGELTSRKISSVHFHGFVPLILGSLSLRRAGFNGHIFYSPHGSKAHRRLAGLGNLAYASLSPLIGGSRLIVLADDLGDTGNKIPMSDEVIRYVPLPVHEAYVDLDHIEAPSPVVIGGSTERSGRDLNAFCQLSVMVPSLTDSARGAEFCWIGPTEPSDAEQLRAAGITLISPHEVTRKREVLSLAWAFVAPLQSRGFPVLAAEAMAAGVPVLAPDRPDYRRLFAASACGLPYLSFGDAVHRLSELLGDTDARQQASAAGRLFFKQTRNEQAFESEVMSHYRADTSPDAGPAGTAIAPAVRS